MEPRIIHFLKEVDDYLKEYLEETKIVKPKERTTKKEEEEDNEEWRTEKEHTDEDFDIGERVLKETIKNKEPDLMSILLTKLDNRTVPSLENFNEETGLSLEPVSYTHLTLPTKRIV